MKNKFGILILISIFVVARYNYLCVIQQINTNQYKSYTYNKPRLVTLFANAFIVGLATSKCGVYYIIKLKCEMRDQHNNLNAKKYSIGNQTDSSRKELRNFLIENNPIETINELLSFYIDNSKDFNHIHRSNLTYNALQIVNFLNRLNV